MIANMVAVTAPVFLFASTRVHHHQSIGFPGLSGVVVLAIVLAVVGVIWIRR